MIYLQRLRLGVSIDLTPEQRGMFQAVRYNFCIPMVTRLMQWIMVALACAGLTLVQPGVSSTWLLDAHQHAAIDADLYGQSPDGHTLPGHAEHPPHQHSADEGLPNSVVIVLQRFDVGYAAAIYWEANRSSLQDCRSEAAVIASVVFLQPPEHPPRV
jgi:hypothetical protein